MGRRIGPSRSSRSGPRRTSSSEECRTRAGTSTARRRTMSSGSIRRDTGRMVFRWLATRFPTTPWADLTRKAVQTGQRQMPRSHAEKYELKTIWSWYPLYCLGGISFVSFIVLTITGIILGFFYIPDGSLQLTSGGEIVNPAWISMNRIMAEVPFGFIVRGMAELAARALVAAVF